MTKEREALKLVLDVLVEINKLSIGENAISLPAEIDTAINAAEEVLAQPEQKPVAIVEASWNDDEGFVLVKRLVKSLPKGSCLYTTPPQRTWVGLTDEDIKAVNAQVSQIPPIDYTTTTYAKAIEAKLKEKNR